ncbi:LLM class flavin-dependent oxidoreductase [Myroides odoratus]|uniref:LLM class flavin-dependent oxidoreductase n=1 Tax=Myroides odoratus TaxID=256 RepID=A0A9Q7E9L2_MYROD|nr:LLM class flavin-dependent oxidoreductase [Myroides odoratus]EHQ41399.1 Luciferase-like, subgroup [Myroides odoratus DSM 2801]EKB08730.1 hypothetical protein HMPREF9716_00781 [Myroides odoratus CIP 103059]QQT98833.1 LLM class flavin-dependent oxidoreductase [Myroides odoratus]WQD58983.1 LLM class flavin-dependent oxidoreductase [Myroides odoratus]STZ32438.1 Limonene 1,2-monooxygenase [Myroides odoratus]
MNNLQIGLLDLGHRENKNSLATFQQILDYACAADTLHFSRFWLAEHHNTNPFAPYTNPEIIITLIAAMTEHIRIGAAGILLNLYEPYHIATTFKLLNNLYNNRIDLGLAKGIPSNHFTKTLINNEGPRNFHSKLDELYNYFQNEDNLIKEKQILIPPFRGIVPDLWYLTNSYKNFPIVIDTKSNLCRSIMHGSQSLELEYEKETLLKQKEIYFKKHGIYPKISLALAIILDTDLRKAEKKNTALNTLNNSESSFITAIPCTYKSLYNLLHDFQDKYGIDEFILYDMESNNNKKIKNIEQISRIMNLQNI